LPCPNIRPNLHDFFIASGELDTIEREQRFRCDSGRSFIAVDEPMVLPDRLRGSS